MKSRVPLEPCGGEEAELLWAPTQRKGGGGKRLVWLPAEREGNKHFHMHASQEPQPHTRKKTDKQKSNTHTHTGRIKLYTSQRCRHAEKRVNPAAQSKHSAVHLKGVGPVSYYCYRMQIKQLRKSRASIPSHVIVNHHDALLQQIEKRLNPH